MSEQNQTTAFPTQQPVNPAAVLEARRHAEQQVAAAVQTIENQIQELAGLYREFGKEIRIEFGPIMKPKRTVHRRTHAEIAAAAVAAAPVVKEPAATPGHAGSAKQKRGSK
jgi:hypothetical protein